MNGGFFHGKDDKYKKKFRKNPPAGAVIPKEDIATFLSPKEELLELNKELRLEIKRTQPV